MKCTPVIALVFLLFSMACTKEKLSPDELKKYIADPGNGLLKEVTINNYKITVYYRPVDLLTEQRLRTMDKPTMDSVAEIKKRYRGIIHFMLSMEYNNQDILNRFSSDKVLFGEMLNRLSFNMGNYVNLVTSNKDTLPVTESIYPRMYGSTHSTAMLFAFDATKINNASSVDFNLKEFGIPVGNNTFRFAMEDLNNTPEMKFNLNHHSNEN